MNRLRARSGTMLDRTRVFVTSAVGLVLHAGWGLPAVDEAESHVRTHRLSGSWAPRHGHQTVTSDDGTTVVFGGCGGVGGPGTCDPFFDDTWVLRRDGAELKEVHVADPPE